MAYNTRFYYEFASADSRQIQVRILEEDYTGTATVANLGPDGPTGVWGRRGVWTRTPILASRVTAPFKRLHGGDTILSELGGAAFDRFRFEVFDVTNSTRLWYGRVFTDEFNTSTMNEPSTVQVEAGDGLGDLKASKEPFLSDTLDENGLREPYSGRVPVIEVLGKALEKTGLGLPLSVSTNWYCYESLNDPLTSGDPLEAFTIDQGVFFDTEEQEAASVYSVIRQICLAFGAQIFQRKGRWYVVQRRQLGAGYTVENYDLTGTHTGTGETVPAATSADDKPKHSGNHNYRSGFGGVLVNFDHGPAESLLRNPGFAAAFRSLRRSRLDTEGEQSLLDLATEWTRYDPDAGVNPGPDSGGVHYKRLFGYEDGDNYYARGTGTADNPSASAETVMRFDSIWHPSGACYDEIRNHVTDATGRDVRYAESVGRRIEEGNRLGLYLRNMLKYGEGGGGGYFQTYFALDLVDPTGADPTTYTLNEDGTWTENPTDTKNPLFWRPVPASMNCEWNKVGVPLKEWTTYSLVTAPTPPGANKYAVRATVYGTSDKQSQDKDIAAVDWSNFDVWVADETGGRRERTEYVAGIDVQQPQKDDIVLLLGQGPILDSENAIHWKQEGYASGWKEGPYLAGSSTTGTDHGALVAEKTQRSQARPLDNRDETYRGIGFQVGEGVGIQGKVYVPTFHEKNWLHDTDRGEWVEKAWYEGTVSTEAFGIQQTGGSLSGGSGGQASGSPTGPAPNPYGAISETNPITSLTADLDSGATVTSLPIESGTPGVLKQGDLIAVISNTSGDITLFRVAADEADGATSLQVEDPINTGAGVTLSAPIPAGSGVFLASRYERQLLSDLQDNIDAVQANVDTNTAAISQNSADIQGNEDRLLDPDAYLFTTTTVHSGSINTLNVSPEDPTQGILKAGDLIRVVSPDATSSVLMRIAADEPDNATSLSVESPTTAGASVSLPFDLPAGSRVEWKPRSLAAAVRASDGGTTNGGGTGGTEAAGHDSGLDTIPSGASSVTVAPPGITEDLRTATIQLTLRNDPGGTDVWVSNVTATDFTVTASAGVGQDVAFDWLVVEGLKTYTETTPTAFSGSEVTAQNVEFSWDAVASDSFSHYRLKYGTVSGSYSTTVDVYPADLSDPNNPTYTLGPFSEGQTVYATVVSVSITGNESAPAPEVAVPIAVQSTYVSTEEATLYWDSATNTGAVSDGAASATEETLPHAKSYTTVDAALTPETVLEGKTFALQPVDPPPVSQLYTRQFTVQSEEPAPDTAFGVPVAPTDPTGTFVFVTDGGEVWTVNPDGTNAQTIATGLGGLRGIAHHPVNGDLYAADTGGDRIIRLTTAGTTVNTVSLAAAYDISITPAGDIYYTTKGTNSGEVRTINADLTGDALAFAPSLNPVYGIDADGTHVFVSDGTNAVARYNPDGTGEVTANAPASSGIWQITSDPANSRVVFGNTNGNSHMPYFDTALTNGQTLSLPGSYYYGGIHHDGAFWTIDNTGDNLVYGKFSGGLGSITIIGTLPPHAGTYRRGFDLIP